MSFADRLLSPVDRLTAALTDPARRERIVLVSLVIYGALWTLFGVLAKANQGVHYDMAELVAWSREPALGYAKTDPPSKTCSCRSRPHASLPPLHSGCR